MIAKSAACVENQLAVEMQIPDDDVFSMTWGRRGTSVTLFTPFLLGCFVWDWLEVIENMERATGFEPATSSLGGAAPARLQIIICGPNNFAR